VGIAARLAAIGLALLLSLVLIVVLAMSFEEEILFPTGAVPRPGPLPAAARELVVEAADGSRLSGTHIPANREPPPGERLLLFGLGGNAWNAADLAAMLHQLAPTADVVTFHYRGYAPSQGRPSAEALIADAPLTLDAAVAETRPDLTIVSGLSIGSGIAATLVGRRPVDGLILVTPFDSLRAVAAGAFPWLPVSALFRNEIDAAAALTESVVPVAVIAAADDEIIPSKRTDGLRARLRNLVFDRTVAGAGHNDLYARREFAEAFDEALRALRK
jgi:pimeloyl-ACP methyl ester carboxylesterase